MFSRIARPQVANLLEVRVSSFRSNFKNDKKWRQQSRFNSSSKGAPASSAWKYGVGIGFVGAVGFATFAIASAEEKKVDYNKVRMDIGAVIAKDENRGPTFVRLAWHAAGTFSKVDNTGGSDGGTIRFQPESGYGANAGLNLARQWLEPVKQANPGISYADLYTLAGVVAIETMSGPKIPWRSGRVDAVDGKVCTPNGRLPDADKGGNQAATKQHIRDIFYRMGFNDQEIVALLGAHSLGRCHTDRSGYDGPWTKSPTVFSNEFFRELLENNWTLRKWKGPQQYADKAGELMMLPADLALVMDPEFKKWVEIYAKDEQKFFKDFSAAFSKLLELGVKNLEKKKGWWPF